MPAVSYRLLVDERPAPPELVAAVRGIEVEDHAQMADIMRLRFAIGVNDAGGRWNVLDEDVFRRLGKVRLDVQVGNRSETLLDARVVETRAAFSNAPGGSTLSVVAMDPSVLMGLDEKVKAWPDMTDSEVADAVFREHGFEPVVDPTSARRSEDRQTLTQRGTDLQFLRMLAQRNGYECFVAVNPSTGAVEGHFHRPRVQTRPQGVLSVNLGTATNVDAFTAWFDHLRPAVAEARGLDAEGQSDQNGDADASADPQMGGEAPQGERPRRVLLSGTGLHDAAELQAAAQAVVDESAWAIHAEGELSAASYGGVLRAKAPVLVRGAGRRFSGLYYVERVTHVLSGEGYVQRFKLRRNASGLVGDERFVQEGPAA